MSKANRVDTVKAREQQRLAPRYGNREAGWIVRALFEDVMGWSPTELVLKGDYELTDHTVNRLDAMTGRIEAGEPVQYVTGTAPFYGLTFRVTPAVLIPRPETAELVDMIADEMKGRADLRVLDCGTGSGCIAIALARTLTFPRITAIDKSSDAIEVARYNAAALRVNVDIHAGDILSLPESDEGIYDVIVSNPPYIAEREKAGMDDNVLQHEPHTALFVPDDDPLVFYRAIAAYALHALSHGGRLYFEINPLFADGVRRLLAPFGDVSITRDSQGRLRFASATRP